MNDNGAFNRPIDLSALRSANGEGTVLDLSRLRVANENPIQVTVICPTRATPRTPKRS
jgi:hypothetical protein